MASSSVVVEGILMIAAVVAASVFASAVMARLLDVKDTMTLMMREYGERAGTGVSIVYATYLSDSGCFAVYLLNTGKTSIVIPRLGVYFGNTTKLDPYVYDVDGVVARGEWTFREVYGVEDGLWNPGETIAVYIYNATDVEPPYVVKIVVPNGYAAQEVFTTLP